MRSNKHIETFKSALLAKNNMGECPFLAEWFKAKVEGLDKLPDEHDRRGIAKGERLPIPRSKYLLALYHITFKKLPLKEFCEVMGVNHGTGRNWRNTDKIFQEISLEFAKEFSCEFHQRYTELVEPRPVDGFSKALDLIRECRHYPTVIVKQIKTRLKNYGGQKRTGVDPLNMLDLVNDILFSILLMSQIEKVEDRRKFSQSMYDRIEQNLHDSFEKLAENKSAETREALNQAEAITYQTISRLGAIIAEFMG
jgi:hypothetical protein